jgi:cbb3-type cytochrome oxidase subunit 3
MQRMNSRPDSDDLSAEEVDFGVTHEYRSPTARRIATAVLVFLILLLLITSLFLLNLMVPRGDIATGLDAADVTWIRSIYGTGPEPEHQLVTPAAVAFMQNGNLAVPIVTENQANIVEFTNSGQYVRWFAGPEGTDYRLTYPTGIAIGDDGSQYYIQGPKDMITSLTPDGKQGRWMVMMEGPSAIASSKDRVAVGGRGGFAILTINGEILFQKGYQGTADDAFDLVGGITFDTEGNIYVVDTYNNRISKYLADGTRQWIVNTGNPGNAAPAGDEQPRVSKSEYPANMQLPNTCVIDGNNRLIVIDPLDFSIAAFNTDDGSFIAKYGTFGVEDGKFSYPSGIDYDPRTDYFAVADTGNNRVQLIRIPGSGGTGLAGELFRTLSGPARACCFPLLLLILLAIIYGLFKIRKKREVEVAYVNPLEEPDMASSDNRGEVAHEDRG